MCFESFAQFHLTFQIVQVVFRWEYLNFSCEKCEFFSFPDAAAEQKARVEEKQRQARKNRRKVKEEWQPRWGILRSSFRRFLDCYSDAGYRSSENYAVKCFCSAFWCKRWVLKHGWAHMFSGKNSSHLPKHVLIRKTGEEYIGEKNWKKNAHRRTFQFGR